MVGTFRYTYNGNYDPAESYDIFVNPNITIDVNGIIENGILYPFNIGKGSYFHPDYSSVFGVYLERTPTSSILYILRNLDIENMDVDKYGVLFDLSDGNGDVTFVGGDFGDVLIGGSGDDVLVGGGGDDILVGGPGANTLTGGPGNDIFRGSAEDLDGDTITDFSLGDRIQLTGSETFQTVNLLPGGTQLQYTVTGDANTYLLHLTGPVPFVTYSETEIGLALPGISIDDVSRIEGNSGTTDFVFTISLDLLSTLDVTFDFSTSDGTADATDYALISGSGKIAVGEQSTTVTISVFGDRQWEPDETFFVNISNSINASVAKGQGVGTILNDDDKPPSNAAPIILSPRLQNAVEGDKAAFTVEARDPDGDALTYAISGGRDADAFVIDAATGQLTFRHMPDFEWPGSAAGTNAYLVEVSVSDGRLTTAKTFEIDVADVDEARVTGTFGDDRFSAGDSPTHFIGLSGLDAVTFSGPAADYAIEKGPHGMLYVTGPHGTDTLSSIERLQFDDGTLAFDTGGTAGQMFRLYQTAFGREPDAEGLGYWIRHQDAGQSSFEDVARSFMASPEFIKLYGDDGTLSDDAFIGLLYANVLGRDPDPGGFAYWLDKLGTGQTSRPDLLAFFSDSNENVAGTADATSDGVWFV
ncbi:DUF4214 domain-containing protein [Mesorhizobium sp. PUT5]|uniref:DUF4214 domain-containing protein n=1 Tax=Mesorhizobium sp. PUT5 TaxID=3454629 RepID=UPI003FA424EB